MMGTSKSALFQVSDRQQPQETEMAKLSVRYIYHKVILQQEWCWPPLQWPGDHTPPMVPQSKPPSNAGDNTRVAGQAFLCLIVLLAVLFLLLCLGKSGKQGLAIWASRRAAVLYRHLCLAGLTPKTRHKATQALYLWAPLIYFKYFFIQNKRKRQLTMDKTVFEASRSQTEAGY